MQYGVHRILTMKQRIDYIDRMKGMAIFLVVMGHVYGFALGQADDVANRVIGSPHAPVYVPLRPCGVVGCYFALLELA